MPWNIREERGLRGYCAEWVGPDGLILSRAERLFAADSLEPPFRPLASFPGPWWKNLPSRLRLGQRVLRWMYYNVVGLDSDTAFLTFGKSLGVLRGGRVELLDPQLARPTRVLRGGCGVTPDGEVFFGEYVPNPERGPIRIYSYSRASNKVRVARQFAAGEIRHIHGIFWDRHEGALWMTAGDVGGECRIVRSRDGFQTMDVVGSGDETWRAVSLQFTADAFYYGTDAEFRANSLYRVDRHTGERTELAQVPQTVFYSQSVGDDLFFGTTAELGSRPESAVWRVGGRSAERVVGYNKDIHHRILFMYGTLHFPLGAAYRDSLLVHGVALSGADNRTFRISRGRV
jgi:hypothetical protein